MYTPLQYTRMLLLYFSYMLYYSKDKIKIQSIWYIISKVHIIILSLVLLYLCVSMNKL
jgi:hypothetical protein